MYCPHCGTQAPSRESRFCSECGREINVPAGHQSEPGPQQTRQNAGYGPSQQRWCGGLPAGRLAVPDSALKTALLAVGVVFLLPFILIAGLVVLGVAVHILPFIVLGVVIYWAMSQRRRWGGVRM